MREYKEIEREVVATLNRLGAMGYDMQELKTFISTMEMSYTDLESAAMERASVEETLSDAANEWPYLNLSDETAEHAQDNI